jgi:hypothetical protein
MVLVGDEEWRGREELRPLEGLHFREVEVAPRAPKSHAVLAPSAGGARDALRVLNCWNF